MKMISLGFLALLAIPAQGAETAVVSETAASIETVLPSYSEPAAQWNSIEDGGSRVCRDRIDQVRDAWGQPKLDREPATLSEPLLLAAVDQRIDGCSVMVTRNDTSDIRPLPEPSHEAEVMPAQ